jgi:hypothetical protein
MKRSLRELLAESLVSVVAIAVLLLWFLDLSFRALWGPLWRIATFLGTAVAIRDIPYIPSSLDASDRVMLYSTLLYSLQAIMSLAGAFLLSHWLYGVGPFRSLASWRAGLRKVNHA